MTGKFKDIQGILDYVAAYSKKTYEEFLDPVSERFAFLRAPTTGEHKGDPMVLVLGNHSSGKSTFINHMLGAEIQRTGLAPIDDGFTIISHGKPDEKDGHAVVTNPELPFADLNKFGPNLISHLKMRRVESPFLKGLSLVDTPGMIDAADEELSRGYDFIGAVRWFVERSDVVCVFFDPDKPGTTGETLQVFTSALLDIDHKLLIVLNKMDQFRTLRDFARAYGALCWNLSKVIPRKDLPMVYNTYVPVKGSAESSLPLDDFADARDEVIEEIRRAPARRIDNILTRIHDHARKLRVQAKVCSSATRSVRAIKFQFTVIGVLALLIGAAAAYLMHTLGASWYVPFGVAAAGLGAGVGLYFFGQWQSKVRGREFLAGLTGVFESVYHKDLVLSGAADDLRALWNSVQERSVKALKTLGVDCIRPLRTSEERKMGVIIEREVPEIRSKVHNAVRDLAQQGKLEGPASLHIPKDALEEEKKGGTAEKKPEAEPKPEKEKEKDAETPVKEAAGEGSDEGSKN
jgi:hypothetical protein